MSSQGMNLVAAKAGGIGQALAPFREALAKSQQAFGEALPATVRKYLTPERLTKITLAAISRSPELLECTPESVLRSVMDAASVGLEIGGPLGQAYLVAYRNGKTGKREAQLMTGYRGLIALARRSGAVSSVVAHVVYARDHYVADLASGTVEHRAYMAALPDDSERMTIDELDAACSRGAPVAVYCVIKQLDGTSTMDQMSMAEVELVRRRAKASESGPWSTDYFEMAKKTIARRALKYAPMATEINDALAAEDACAVELAPEKPRAFGFGPALKEAQTAFAEPPHDAATGEVRDEPPAFDGPDVPDFDSGEPVAPRSKPDRKRTREPGEEG